MRGWALLVLPLALASCAPEPPGGQVVARVDGIDITRRDLLIELMATGAPVDADTSTLQPALLERILARKLIVAEARRQDVDRSPEFLGQERRGYDLLMVDQLRQRIAARLPTPSQAAVTDYVAAHRRDFDERRLLQVDRIVLESVGDADSRTQAMSNDEVASRLDRASLGYRRAMMIVDSLDLPPAHVAALATAPARPVAMRQADQLVIDQLVSSTPAPVNPADRARIAAIKVKELAAQAAFERVYRGLRARARIEYQPGFAQGAARTQ